MNRAVEGATTPTRPSARRKVARLATEVLAPAPTAAALLVAVAWRSASGTAQGAGWALLAVLIVILVPLLYVVRGVRRRRFSDHHVGVREQRPLPLLVGVASVLIAWALLAAAGAPRDLVALVGAMAVGLSASLLVTLVWKISVHAAVSAGAVVILVLIFGPALLILASLAVLVGWARVELGDHTPPQVVTGAGLGAFVAATIFTLLR
jgi:membrane-associated phospholipid phosphatase